MVYRALRREEKVDDVTKTLSSAAENFSYVNIVLNCIEIYSYMMRETLDSVRIYSTTN